MRHRSDAAPDLTEAENAERLSRDLHTGGELARLLELTCAVAVLQDVERLGAGEHQQHRVLGDRHAVAAAGIDHADAVTTAALQVDCIDAGAVACDDLEPRARGDHCVAHHGEAGDHAVAVL